MNADDFLADHFAALPVSAAPWVCMICGARHTTLDDLNAHLDTHPDDEDDA